jgi:eukaryotic-like serine/threonine-protein kinase
VVGRLECIFEIGSLERKATAALATAELRVSHNRWYVMRRLMAICGPSLDEIVAKRIAIEIIVEEAQYRFTATAAGIGMTVSSLHPLIAEVLELK